MKRIISNDSFQQLGGSDYYSNFTSPKNAGRGFGKVETLDAYIKKNLSNMNPPMVDSKQRFHNQNQSQTMYKSIDIGGKTMNQGELKDSDGKSQITEDLEIKDHE